MIEASLSINTTPLSDVSAMALNEDSIIVATEHLLSCDLPEGAVILDLDSGVYYSLDPVGTYIWKLVQEPRGLRDITAAVLEEYEVQAVDCERDLRRLFEEMSQCNLIEVCNE